MKEEELFEIYEYLKNKNIPVDWQNYEPCLKIPVTTYSRDNGIESTNVVCLFAGTNEWQLDDWAWDSIDE